MSNVCTRCGKERIIVEDYIENFETDRRTNSIRHIKTVCPDPECQKKVELNIEKEKQKNDERRSEKAEKDKLILEERKKRMDNILAKSKKRKK